MDHLIDICPKCKSPYNIPTRRRGPTVLKYDKNNYRVICLNCWKLGVMQSTGNKAIESWNDREVYKKDHIPDYAIRLKKLRTEMGLSQVALSKKAGLGKNTLYTIEHGEKFPKPETIQKLEAVLQSPIFI
jgi:ribosome-binding protein aMBF1 (putative translation factor)